MSVDWKVNILYFLAGLIALLGCWTVFTQHILRSAAGLMGVLFLSAAVYLLLGAEFMAAAQVLVYVGGIVVLLVFGVLLTQSKDLIVDRPSVRRKLLGALAAGAFFAFSSFLLLNSPLAQNSPLPTEAPTSTSTSMANLGQALLDASENGYALPFETVSILLLAVLIGGSVIARKEKGN